MRFEEIKLGWYLRGTQKIEVVGVHHTSEGISLDIGHDDRGDCDYGLSNTYHGNIKSVATWVRDDPGYKLTLEQIKYIYALGRHASGSIFSSDTTVEDFLKEKNIRLIK